MHHKRKGPKSTRAGCLLCKPHKRQGAPKRLRQRHSINRILVEDRGDLVIEREWARAPKASVDPDGFREGTTR